VNPDQEYAETGARPLFSPTRRPAPALAQANVGSMAKGQFILTGVISAGGMKIALLREKASGRVVRVEQGKDVNGITVAQIEPEQVTLAQGGDQEVVPLLVTKGAPAAPTPAVPAAPVAAGPFAAPAAPNPAPGANPAARPPGPAVAQPPPSRRPRHRLARIRTCFSAPSGWPHARQQLHSSSAGSHDWHAANSQAAPLTPEELLARRRARRTQQSQ
jgi:hypothetical protein